MVAGLADKLRMAFHPSRSPRSAPEVAGRDTTGELHADDVQASRPAQGIPPLDGEGPCTRVPGGAKAVAEGNAQGAPTRATAMQRKATNRAGRAQGLFRGAGGKGSAVTCSEGHNWKTGCTFSLIPGRLSFAVHKSDAQTKSEIKLHPSLFFFSSDFQERYEPFCADFGPVNLGIVHSFCSMMRGFMTDTRILKREIVYYTSAASKYCTNAAFLVASYMVIEHGKTPAEAWAPFEEMLHSPIVPFRDASFLPDSYELTVRACLEGLKKAMSVGWYHPATFDLEEYDYLDNPKHADMHFLSPKMAGFKGPNNHTRLMMHGVYTFSPRHYAELFAELDITGVVRLNEARTYRRTAFTELGFDHIDLYFDDCTVPSNDLVHRFIDFCESQKGSVAVHCKAGLGRTGTMIGVWFMLKFGFTASECIGWMRIVRPGCVIGPQQQYLHWAEKQLVADPEGGGRLLWRPTGEPRDEDGLAFDTSQSVEMGEAITRASSARAGARVGEMVVVEEKPVEEEEDEASEERMMKGGGVHACDVKG